MNIKVKEESVGECIINSFKSVDKQSKYLVKAMAAIILLCINSDEDKQKQRELSDILKEAANKANELYSEDLKESTYNVTEFFNKN